MLIDELAAGNLQIITSQCSYFYMVTVQNDRLEISLGILGMALSSFQIAALALL